MEALTAIFGHVCGQARCFVVDGVALPVCARCTGLYLGALLTGLWLLAGGLRRRGLPDRHVVVLQVGALILALLGGIHVVDFGARWRLLCGLWTGHVAVVWLVTGAAQLGAWLGGLPADPLNWSPRQTRTALMAIGIMPVLAGLTATLPPRGWWGATVGVVGGAAVLALAVGQVLLVPLFRHSRKRGRG
jgi:uncharacterized membrane protein